MTEKELRDLLERMYRVSKYSDEHISKEQYEYYTGLLDVAEKEGNVKDVIQEIIYELDIALPGVGRRIAYPFSFNSEVMNWMREQIKDGKYYCVACKTWHEYQDEDPSKVLSIDHEPPLSARFNAGEYKLSKEERRASYNDINRLQIMCQGANSAKGGPLYNKELLMQVFLREL